jgi:hypothetical protein
MSGTLNDVRFAIRLVLRHPLVTAAATVSMALGIGLNSMLFICSSLRRWRPAICRHGARRCSIH